MFLSADAAACMPCHEDWLNDLSLIPPVSVTIQPVNLAAAPAPVPLPEDDELGLAHPAATKATAASAAAAWKAFLTCYLLFRGACCRPLRERLRNLVSPAPSSTQSDRGGRPPDTLLRDDRRLDLASRPGKVAGSDPRCRCQIATGTVSCGRPGGGLPGCFPCSFVVFDSAGAFCLSFSIAPGRRCYGVQPEGCDGYRLARAAGRRGAGGGTRLRAVLATAGGRGGRDQRRPGGRGLQRRERLLRADPVRRMRPCLRAARRRRRDAGGGERGRRGRAPAAALRAVPPAADGGRWAGPAGGHRGGTHPPGPPAALAVHRCGPARAGRRWLRTTGPGTAPGPRQRPRRGPREAEAGAIHPTGACPSRPGRRRRYSCQTRRRAAVWPGHSVGHRGLPAR